MKAFSYSALLAGGLVLTGLVAGCGRDPVSTALKAIDNGNPAKAEAILEQAVKQDPSDASALANLAILRYRNGQWDAALTDFSKVADMAPDDPRPIEFIVAMWMENSNWQEAGALLTDAAKRDPRSPSILTAQAVVELYTLGAPAARTRLFQVLDMDPRYAPALFNLAVINRDWLKNTPEARRYFQRYLAVARNDIHAPIAKAALAEKPAASPVRKPAGAIHRGSR